MQLELNSEMFNAILYNVKNLISIYKMYVTLRFDDNGCCRIHSVSDDGNGRIVTKERYVIMPWKMVTRYGKNMGPHSGPGPCGAMTLAEVVDGIFSKRESEAKEREKREREKEEIEKKHKEYYEANMKEETERLNKLVDWFKFKLNEIREAPVDSRPRKLSRLYQISEKNKHLGVTITRAGTINLVNYPGYPPELKLPEDNNEEDPFWEAPKLGSLPVGCKPSNQLNYFKQIIRAYQGRDEDAAKYIKKVKELIDKPLDKLELRHVRLVMAKVKCLRKLDILVFYQLTRRLQHEDGLNYDDERLLIHFYDTFCNESIRLLGPLTYPSIFQCDNGSEFKGEMTKMLEKHEVKIRRVTTKYAHTHTAFVEALNKILAERLFKVQDAQELNDPEKVSSRWVKHLYGLVD